MAIENGVKCIEHGNLVDEPTLKLMKDKGIWLSPQVSDEEVRRVHGRRRPGRLERVGDRRAPPSWTAYDGEVIRLEKAQSCTSMPCASASSPRRSSMVMGKSHQ
ncbi:MAG: hypothetical protein ACREYC_07275 [Gammaproteobacteria bacterium]